MHSSYKKKVLLTFLLIYAIIEIILFYFVHLEVVSTMPGGQAHYVEIFSIFLTVGIILPILFFVFIYRRIK